MLLILSIVGSLLFVFLLVVFYFHLMFLGVRTYWRCFVRYNIYPDGKRKTEFATDVMQKDKQIGRYRKINGKYTVWVMGIGKLDTTYKTKKESYQAVINNYLSLRS